MQRLKILLCGGGIAGSFAGLLLARRGHDVTIFERRSEQEASRSQKGRTINFTLSERGRNALVDAGILNEALALTVPLYGRMVHLPGVGRALKSPYGFSPTDRLDSISRLDLHRLLLKKVRDQANITYLFEHQLVDLAPERKFAVLKDERGETHTHCKIPFDLFIGADGARSKTRQLLRDKLYLSASLTESEWRYTENLDAQPLSNAEASYLHLWPRWDHVTCGIPDRNGHLLLNHIFRDPLGERPNSHAISRVQASRWSVDDAVLLIGDAAHAISPFLGQGANFALEDAAVLDRLLSGQGQLSAEKLRTFELSRKPLADALFQQSEQHFLTLARKFLNPLHILSENVQATLRDRAARKPSSLLAISIGALLQKNTYKQMTCSALS